MPHPSPRQPRRRCAYALAASASASGLELRVGVAVPRRFRFEEVDAILENGVARDVLKVEMADLVGAGDPLSKAFRLNARQVGLVVRLIGADALAVRGLI